MIFQNGKNENGKRSKKRRNDQDEEEYSVKSDDRRTLQELVSRSEYVLESVKYSCIYDTEGFIDEVRA